MFFRVIFAFGQNQKPQHSFAKIFLKIKFFGPKKGAFSAGIGSLVTKIFMFFAIFWFPTDFSSQATIIVQGQILETMEKFIL